jgi:hypothetical protein
MKFLALAAFGAVLLGAPSAAAIAVVACPTQPILDLKVVEISGSDCEQAETSSWGGAAPSVPVCTPDVGPFSVAGHDIFVPGGCGTTLGGNPVGFQNQPGSSDVVTLCVAATAGPSLCQTAPLPTDANCDLAGAFHVAHNLAPSVLTSLDGQCA